MLKKYFIRHYAIVLVLFFFDNFFMQQVCLYTKISPKLRIWMLIAKIQLKLFKSAFWNLKIIFSKKVEN